MPYSCTTQRLFDVLAVVSPHEVTKLRAEYRRVEHGLLSVGLKIHMLASTPGFAQFLSALGGREGALPANMYKRKDANFCLVLPPVGSARNAIALVRCIERYTGCAIFGNPSMQLQVCSPGRLDARRAAMLAVAFYLGSDTLRRYNESQFTTTVSYDDRYKRGTRIVLYDAGERGEFDRGFAWWEKKSARVIRPELPFEKALRTDLLIGTASPIDIENINLVATLLTHRRYHQHAGYWYALGHSLEKDLAHIMNTHMLSGILSAPWAHEGGVMDIAGDQNFLGALQELTAYAFEEVERVSKHQNSRMNRLWGTLKPSILDEVRAVLEGYRKALVMQSDAPEGGVT